MIPYLILSLLFAILYLILIKPHSFWKNRGVLQSSVWQNIKDLFANIIGTETPSSLTLRFYQRFPNARCYGVYQFTTPLLLIKDPELLKEILVKHFDHFTNHRHLTVSEDDTFWTKNLFGLEDEKWKKTRHIVSPTLTTSKMRTMFGLMQNAADQYVNYYLKQPKDVMDVELKDSLRRLSGDVIATCAFGFENNSMEEKDNDFYVYATMGSNFTSTSNIIKMLMIMNFPKLAKLFSVELMPAKVTEFFKQVTFTNMRVRKENKIYRPDVINLLMETREDPNAANEESVNTKAMKLSDDDIVAQAMSFIIAAFETVSNTLTFCLYELALNPDIQNQVKEEIDNVLKSSNGEITYDTLKSLKYMDMVLSETLRKWPPGFQLDRVCTKPFTIEPHGENETAVNVMVGDVVILSPYGLHHDPRYFPEPDRFDPDRFSDSNKENIVPYTYVPFGAGPRSCIGNRFAQVEIKTILVRLLTKFELVVSEKTEIPVQLVSSNVFIAPKNGLWIGYKKREQKN